MDGAQGMALLTVSAALPQFRPPSCKPGGAVTCQEAAPWQLAVLYVSLLLNAVGAGGYRPCIVAFGADQFDESRAAERARSWGFFNWYYFCNGASMLLAVTAVVYVQDNVGWGWGLGVPAFCMGVSVAAFVAGYPMYRRLEPVHADRAGGRRRCQEAAAAGGGRRPRKAVRERRARRAHLHVRQACAHGSAQVRTCVRCHALLSLPCTELVGLRRVWFELLNFSSY